MDYKILDVPFKRQEQGNTCGAACLEMILRYYGMDIAEKQVSKELLVTSPETGRAYIRTSHLVHYAELMGFNTVYSCMNSVEDLFRLIDNGYPVIVLQRHSVKNEKLAHFRVVIGYRKKSLIINDPEQGQNMVLPLDTFKSMWKRQEAGENTQSHVFILIYPHDKIVNHGDYNYDPLLLRSCRNPKCPDPYQEKISSFYCNSCGKQMTNDGTGIPLGCTNPQCKSKYWIYYTCDCGCKNEL